MRQAVRAPAELPSTVHLLRTDVPPQRHYASGPGAAERSIDDRKRADALACRREDRIRDRRCDDSRPGFADAAGRLSALHEMGLDHRCFIHSNRSVGVEIALLDAAVLQIDLTVHCSRQPEDRSAFHLRGHYVGINDDTTVYRANDALHANRTVTRYLDFRHLREITAEGMLQGHAATLTGRQG